MNDYEIHVELDDYSYDLEKRIVGWKISCIEDYDPTIPDVWKTYILTAHESSEANAYKKLESLAKRLGPSITRKKIEHIIFDERIK